MTAHRIILVEDNPNDREFMRFAFTDAGIDIEWTELEHGQAAIDWFDRLRPDTSLPDLMLLDINMPLRDGFEVLAHRLTLEDPPPFPVVVLTTSHAPWDHERAMELGADGVLTKPYDLDGLREVVSQLRAHL